MTHEEIKNAFERFYLEHCLHFEPKGHQYKIDGITCAGISSISEYRPKNWMPAWGANMACEYIDSKSTEFFNNPTLFKDILEQARKAYARKSKTALDVGERVHKFIQLWIEAEINRLNYEGKHERKKEKI